MLRGYSRKTGNSSIRLPPSPPFCSPPSGSYFIHIARILSAVFFHASATVFPSPSILTLLYGLNRRIVTFPGQSSTAWALFQTDLTTN